METVTPAGLPPENAPAPDVTGPDITPAGLPPADPADPEADKPVTPAGLPPRPRILGGRPMPMAGLMMTALAGIGLISVIGGAGRLLGGRFRGPVPQGRRAA